MTTHITEVKFKLCLALVEFFTSIYLCGLYCGRSIVEDIYNLMDVLCPIDMKLIYHRSLSHILLGNNKSFIPHTPCHYCDGQCTAYGQQRTIKTEFTHQEKVLKSLRFHLILCSQNGNSNGEVICRTFFFQVCRRKIYRKCSNGEMVTAILDSSNYALITFFYRIVGQTNQIELYTSGAINFSGDGDGF